MPPAAGRAGERDSVPRSPAALPGLWRARARARAQHAWDTSQHRQNSAAASVAGAREGSGKEAIPVRLAGIRERADIPEIWPLADDLGGLAVRPGTRRRLVVAAGAGVAAAVAAIVLGTEWAVGDRAPAAVGAVPGGFVGRWNGTVVQEETTAVTTVVLRGGGVGAAVGEVITDSESPTLRCTAGLELVSVEEPVLIVRVQAGDAARCGLAYVARLTLHDDGTLGFYVDATHRSPGGGGRLRRV